MTTETLEKLIEDFNSRYKLTERQFPCFSGALKGIYASCRDFQLYHLSPAGWVISRIDDWSQKKLPGNHDVIITVGINYGQTPPRHPIYDSTGMRGNLDNTFRLAHTNLRHGCFVNHWPSPNTYHLIAYNFFPWLTTKRWLKLKMNGIHEALFLYCHGYSDLFEPLRQLLATLGTGKENVTWLVFHGANNLVPSLGAAFCQTLRPHEKPDVLFCDNWLIP